MEKQVQTLKLLQKSRCLEVAYADGTTFNLPCAYLRTHSPASEGKLEPSAQAILEKQALNIERIEAVGNYAVKFHFTDGHNTSIYSWDYLYELGQRLTGTA